MCVDTAVRRLWSAHANAIKERCAAYMPKGLLDQQEVFGFALADGLGRDIIPGDRARSVGQAGDDAIKGAKGTAKKPGPLVRAREAAREAVRKATRAAEKDAALSSGIVDAERDGTAAVGLVLDKIYDLKLPNETVGAKRKRAAIAKAADVEARPSLPELSAAVAKAQRVLCAAEEAHAAAAAAAELDVARAQRRLDALGPWPTFDESWDQAIKATCKPWGVSSDEEHLQRLWVTDMSDPHALDYSIWWLGPGKRAAEDAHDAKLEPFERAMEAVRSAQANVPCSSLAVSAARADLRDRERALENARAAMEEDTRWAEVGAEMARLRAENEDLRLTRRVLYQELWQADWQLSNTQEVVDAYSEQDGEDNMSDRCVELEADLTRSRVAEQVLRKRVLDEVTRVRELEAEVARLKGDV